jgi:hypothetical protein
MKEHVPRKDFDVAVSPQMQSLIDKHLDRSGIDPSTDEGFGKSHYILQHMANVHPKANVVFPLENRPGIIHMHTDLSYDDSSTLRMAGSLHPAVTQTVRKRIINHGDKISDLHELHNHLYNLHVTLPRYRDVVGPTAHDMGYVQDKDKVIYNPIPQKEQFQISNQIKRMISHPNFNDENTETHLTPTHMSNMLSSAHHIEGISSGDATRHTGKSMHKLFQDVLSDPHVRNDFHNFLDNYETKGESQKRLAAAMRGHMIKSPHMVGSEKSRMLHKYANDTNSIDVGKSGYFVVPSNRESNEVHPMQGIRRLDDPKLQEFRKNDPSLWGRSYWNTVPLGIGDSNEHHSKVLRYLTDSHNFHEKHTKEELIDMLGTAHHLIETHPTYQFSHMKNAYEFNNGSLRQDIHQRGVNALSRVLQKENPGERRANPRISEEDAKQLITGRAAMKAAGITK